MKNFLIYIICLASIGLNANNIDSLGVALHSAKGADKIEILEQLYNQTNNKRIIINELF